MKNPLRQLQEKDLVLYHPFEDYAGSCQDVCVSVCVRGAYRS